jgi:hypothetical protein
MGKEHPMQFIEERIRDLDRKLNLRLQNMLLAVLELLEIPNYLGSDLL